MVDSDYLSSCGYEIREVKNGCFCCNYDQLIDAIETLNKSEYEVVFAEAVGSCTDIVATIINPLLLGGGQGLEISLTIFVDTNILFDVLEEEHQSILPNNIKYLYLRQLEEADVIVVNKIDLLDNKLKENFRRTVKLKFQNKTIFYQNSLIKNGSIKWLSFIMNYAFNTTRRSMDIDYTLYGKAEASLAWLDQKMIITTESGNSIDVAVTFMNELYHMIKRNRWLIGHLKFLLNNGRKQMKISFTSNPNDVQELSFEYNETNYLSILINARVMTSPKYLRAVVDEIVNNLIVFSKCKIEIISSNYFSPKFPKPKNRIGSIF